MGRDRGEQSTPDLFSTDTVRHTSLSPLKSVAATQISADTSPQRHVLPKNLRKAVKHLSDSELDLLHAATTEELQRRGRFPLTDQITNRSSGTDKSPHKRQAETAPVSLTRGQINAVRAAIQSGHQTISDCAAVSHISIRCTQGLGVRCHGPWKIDPDPLSAAINSEIMQSPCFKIVQWLFETSGPQVDAPILF
jgi:hypothetical protein